MDLLADLRMSSMGIKSWAYECICIHSLKSGRRRPWAQRTYPVQSRSRPPRRRTVRPRRTRRSRQRRRTRRIHRTRLITPCHPRKDGGRTPQCLEMIWTCRIAIMRYTSQGILNGIFIGVYYVQPVVCFMCQVSFTSRKWTLILPPSIIEPVG